MPTITFTLPVAGTGVVAGPIATNFSNLQALLNGGLDTANLNTTGTPSASTFLRGDMSWATPALPWLVDVDVFPTAVAHTNWDTIAFDATTSLYSGTKNSSGAQNDEINFDVILSAGTWTVELIHATGANRGIYSIQFDGVEKGTIDGYNAGGATNVRSSVGSITVSTPGKVRLKIKMATKNASSSSYFGLLHHVQLRRTA